MTTLRIALPEALRPAAETAALGLPGPRPQWLSPALPAEPRQRQRLLRLWLERRAGHGGNPAEAEAALQSPALRAVLWALDGGAEAAVVSEADPGWAAAWSLAEPRLPGGVCADLWIGELPPGGEGLLGWLDWPAADGSAPAAAALCVATAELAGLAQRPAVACLVNFSGGKNPLRAPSERLLATLRARSACHAVALYSPLFYKDGLLQAGPLLRAVRQQLPSAALPMICVPQLGRAEFAAALRAAGGAWAGPLRAGAEVALARLAPGDEAAAARTLLPWLLRRAALRAS